MNIMGIDPGLDGGIAVIQDNGKLVFIRKMPTVVVEENKKKKRRVDIAQFAGVLAKYEPDHVFIEKVHAMPGQGVTSMFNFGMGYGMILGLCLALDDLIKTELVTPQKWQKMMHVGINPEAPPKERSIAKMYELFPEWKELTHDGMIDAALIADYGRRFLNLN